MKEFNFSLERVLKVREITEEDLQQQLKQAQEEKEKQEERLTGLLEQHEQYKTEFLDNVDKPMKVCDIQHYSSYFPRLIRRIDEQRQRLQQAEKHLNKCYLEWQEARKERKIMENLKEKKREQHRREWLKTEQKFFDELAQNPKRI